MNTTNTTPQALAAALELAKDLLRQRNELSAVLDAICDLEADDAGERIIPAGFLDAARAALAN